MIEQNKALIQRFYDAVNGNPKPMSLLDTFIADSAHTLKQAIADADVAFPNYELILEDMIAEGDQVAARISLRGRHVNEFAGVPGSGKEGNITGLVIYRIADGKIVEYWMQLDSMSLMQQITTGA